MEVERARVTRILSDIKKEQGDLTAAASILCELQVETFGSMSRREKTEFILEQVGLCIEKGDWTQAGILARKISTRYFSRRPPKPKEQLEKEKKEREEKEKKRLDDLSAAGDDTSNRLDEPPAEGEDDVTDLKLRFYEQQILLAKHEDKYLDACKNWRQVLDTEAVENNPEQLQTVGHTKFSRQMHQLTYPIGLTTCHLFRHPCPLRQRTIRPPPTHTSRRSQRPDPRRCTTPQTLHRPRTHAMANSVTTIRTPPLRERRVLRREVNLAHRRRQQVASALGRPPEACHRAQRPRRGQILHEDTVYAADGAPGSYRGRDGEVHQRAGDGENDIRED